MTNEKAQAKKSLLDLLEARRARLMRRVDALEETIERGDGGSASIELHAIEDELEHIRDLYRSLAG